MNPPLDLIATTAFGLEAVVRRELAALGYDGAVASPGRVHFRGDLAAICRTNLWLRVADRVLVRIAAFHAEDFDALFETTKSIDWAAWIGADAEFPVIGRSIKSQLSSVPACQRAVKKAVVESLFAGHHVDTLPETGPQTKIEVALLKNEVTLTIDTTGPSLHKRGYRQGTTKAPLKETLAAAMVLLSFWDGERPLIDPFCGAAAIPIEAAMIGCHLAPGLKRAFAAEAWPIISGRLWEEARAEAGDLAKAKLAERLIGTDIDPQALKWARLNAEQAGVGEQIHFQEQPFSSLTSQRPFGCIVTNPPYGQRLGEQQDWESLYRSIPEVLRKLPTWSHYILTAFPNFESLVGREADRRRKLYNGRIECTYYQFHGPKPGSTPPDRGPVPNEQNRAAPEAATPEAATIDIATVDDGATAHLKKPMRPRPTSQCSTSEAAPPVFGGLTHKALEQAELFRRRLQKRARHLRRWPTRQGITCFRLYDCDIPEIPLVVDRYEDHLHMAEVERPHDRDLAQHANWLDLMARTAGETLEVDRRNIYFKRRSRQLGASQHQRLADKRHEIVVNEGGLRFVVNLSDYVDTGLFLDHRIARSMVRDLAQGAVFLNLFGYTGAFTVYAASGGAARTTTVDLSRTYLDWAQRNMALNEFATGRHRYVCGDAFDYLRQLPKAETYDLAVVDPPTFSNSKSNAADWNIQKHYAALLNELLPRVRPGGTIFFSTNFRRFKMDEAAIHSPHIREISRQTVPADFRNRRIHRCWRIIRGDDRIARP